MRNKTNLLSSLDKIQTELDLPVNQDLCLILPSSKVHSVVFLSRAGAQGRTCARSHTVGWVCPRIIRINWFSEPCLPWHVSVIVRLAYVMPLRMGGWDSCDTPWGYLHNLVLLLGLPVCPQGRYILVGF